MSVFQRHSISWLEIWLISLVAIFLVIVALLSFHIHSTHQSHRVRSKSLQTIKLDRQDIPNLDTILNNVEINEMERLVEEHSLRRGVVSNKVTPVSPLDQSFIPPPLSLPNDMHPSYNPPVKIQKPISPQESHLQRQNVQQPELESPTKAELTLSDNELLLIVLDDIQLTLSNGARHPIMAGSLVVAGFDSGCAQTINQLRITYPVKGTIVFDSEQERGSLSVLNVSHEQGMIHNDRILMNCLVETHGLKVVHSPFSINTTGILSLEDSSGQWGQQFPIGNGLFGAFVGGTNQHEIIPLSTNDFYVYSREAMESVQHGRPIDHENAEKDMPDTPTANAPADSPPASFPRFPLHNYLQHEERLKEHIQGSLGYFEYLLDIVMLFDSSDFSELQNQMRFPTHSRPNAKQPKPVPAPKLAPEKLCRRNPMTRNRQVLLCDAQRHLSQHIKGSSFWEEKDIQTSEKSSRIVIAQQSYLNLQRGISNSFLLDVDGFANTASETEKSRQAKFQYREWFVNEEYQVMVGQYHCLLMGGVSSHNLNGQRNCLDWTIFINRQARPNQEDPTDSQALQFATNWSQQQRPHPFGSSLQNRDTVGSVAMTATVKSSPSKLSPTVVVCALFFCLEDGANHSSQFQDGDIFHCEGAQQGLLLLSIAKAESLLGQDPRKYIEQDEKRLSEKCWEQLNRANEASVNVLRENHLQAFANRMTRVEVSIESSSDKKSVLTANNMFQYGRYLMFSSTSRNSVANLQGLWSEGPFSAWNGDYHVNINMQMIYWTMFSVGLDEAVPGFLRFVQKVSEQGRETAKNVYGFQNEISRKQAWVMHGFTDSTLRGDLFSDLQWAMCITCGAWLSTHLFEMASYQAWDRKLVKNSILPIVREALNFFHYHIWFTPSNSCQPLQHPPISLDGVRAHTGPTTSPENSMRIKPINALSFLTLSPAIDVSVLRELTNAFYLLIEWIAQDESSDYQELKQDRELARTMKDIVYQLPNNGIPKLFPKSHRIMEYPDQCATQRMMLPPNTPEDQVTLDEDFDVGHRHFSLMHWLYPATLHPRMTEELHQSSVNTMHGKLNHGGAHTAWSSAWAGTLWARLGAGEEAWKSLRSILSNYTATNMLTLHPPLQGTDADPSCVTCYAERLCPLKKNTPKELFRIPSPSRGFTDACGDVFQLDGNMGFVATMVEMLVHSHIPGWIHLLPSVPDEWSAGTVKGLRVRGNAQVSIHWEAHNIVVAFLSFGSNHPWWRGVSIETDRDGLYEVNPNQYTVNLLSKNKIKAVDVSGDINDPNSSFQSCSMSVSFDTFHRSSSVQQDVHSISFQQTQMIFPCGILLCDMQINDEQCKREYQYRFKS